MTIRTDMLAALRAARVARGPLIDTLHAARCERGGFADRAGRCDLYYTLFGVESLMALDGPLDPRPLGEYLDSVAPGALDLVHTCCLIRLRADLAELAGRNIAPACRATLVDRLRSFRTGDGGFGPDPAGPATMLGCMLAAGAMQDLDEPVPADELAPLIDSFTDGQGGFANTPGQAALTTPATAAGVTLLAQLSRPAPPASLDWLRARQGPDGGFQAAPAVPFGDLLSTAVALFALRQNGAELDDDAIQRAGAFLDARRIDGGGWAGSVADPVGDCEYLFYALLAGGVLEGCGHV